MLGMEFGDGNRQTNKGLSLSMATARGSKPRCGGRSMITVQTVALLKKLGESTTRIYPAGALTHGVARSTSRQAAGRCATRHDMASTQHLI